MKKRVLFLVPHLSTGGMPQYTLDLMKKLIDNTDVYCVEYSMVSPDFVVQRNRVIELLNDRLITLSDDKSELFKVIDTIEPDIIHLQELPEYFMSDEIATKLYDKNRSYLIVETSHDSSFSAGAKRFYPDHLALISPFQQAEFSKLNIPIDLIESDIEHVDRADRTIGLLDLGLDPSLKHVLNVGLFTPRKNQAEVIEYARIFETMNLPVQFHFVGNQAGNFQSYWEPLMKDLPSNVKIWGERSDVTKFYSCMDLFLFTSRGTGNDKETSPLVIRESIGHGIPALIYNLPVYMGMYDMYESITYLQQDTSKNIVLIQQKLNLLPESPKLDLSLDHSVPHEKTAIIIDAYPNTDEKLRLLEDCIETVGKLNGDIILVSHCPIPEHILRKVQYHIFDSDNTFNANHVYAYKQSGNTEVQIQIRKSHEYPIIRSMRNGFLFAKAHGYDFVYFTEFDHRYADIDITKIKQLRYRMQTENKKFIFFRPIHAIYGDIQGLYYETSFFGANVNEFVDIFETYFPHNIDAYNQWFSVRFPNCLEHFFYEAFSPRLADTVLTEDYVKLYLNNSDINISSYQNVQAKILLTSDNQPYLYFCNENLLPYTLDVFFGFQLIDSFNMQNVFLQGNFKVIPIDTTLPNDTIITIQITDSNNTVIDKLELMYSSEKFDEYKQDGIVIFNGQRPMPTLPPIVEPSHAPFSFKFDDDTNKLTFTANRDVAESVLISIKDIDSRACIFSFKTHPMQKGFTHWAIPLPTNVFSFKNHINFGGLLVQYFDGNDETKLIAEEELRIKSVPFYKPLMDLTNTEPIYNNYDEFFVQKIYSTLDIDGCDTVIDAGANIGLWTRYILTRNAKRILCIEPNTVALQNLTKNTKQFGDTVTVVPYALHTENGTLKFYSDKNSLVSSIFPTGESVETTVNTITFDSLLEQYGVTYVDLLKMDIEGAEFAIIESFGKEQFDKIGSFLIEYHEWNGGSKDSLISKLQDNGYKIKTVDGSMFLFAYKQRRSYLMPPSTMAPYTQPNLTFEPINLYNASKKFTWADFGLGKHYIFEQMYAELYNEFNYNETGCSYERYGCMLEKGDIVLDAGANIGMFSNLAYERGASKIFSFEPTSVAYHCLEHNKPDNCHTFKMALSDKMGLVEIKSPRLFDPMGAGIYKDSEQFPVSEYVCSTTIDALFNDGLFDRIDFLKMDVEGSELAILNGISDENLKKIRKISMEFHLNDLGEEGSQKIWDRMTANGFTGFNLIYGDGKLRIYSFWRA